MDPKELRIGNYFHPMGYANNTALMPYTGIIYMVGAISPFNIEVIEHNRPKNLSFKFSEVSPVVLTPDILNKCGFKIDENYELKAVADRYILPVIISGSTKCELVAVHVRDENEIYCFYLVEGFWASNNFNKLHELQNLYYILTGNELPILL